MALSELAAKRVLAGIILLVSVYFVAQAALVSSWGPLNNYLNYSVKTTVNVTEAYPEILSVYCNGGSSVTLSAGTTQNVTCLVVIQDYNGGESINGSSNATVNGTFYYLLNTSTDTDDNNTHYTNLSCEQASDPWGVGNYLINWSCAFDVWYYANNGTWYTNVTILDRHNERNLTATGYNTSDIDPLYAINVTDVIDFGEMFTGETTVAPGVQANVTNFGNVPINFTVYGYGGEDPVVWAGYAMNCSIARNISINNEKYAIDPTVEFGEMTTISATPTMVTNNTLVKQTLPDNQITNATYWGLHINVTDNPFGICQGTVIFSAVSSI